MESIYELRAENQALRAEVARLQAAYADLYERHMGEIAYSTLSPEDVKLSSPKPASERPRAARAPRVRK